MPIPGKDKNKQGTQTHREESMQRSKPHLLLWRTSPFCLVSLVLLLSVGRADQGAAQTMSKPGDAQPEQKQPEQKQPEQKQPEQKQPEQKQPEQKQPEQKQPEQKPEGKPAPKTNPDEFPPNPLDITTPDPLLPNSAKQRPLSALERKQLAATLDGLNSQAAEKLKQHDRVGAFALWYRELRLRRSLGALEEVAALGRVGEIAWKENLTPDVRWISKRLDAILAQNQLTTGTTPDSTSAIPVGSSTLSHDDRANRIAVLDALGLAYQKVRLPQTAVSAYQQVLIDAQQRHDEKKVDETLIAMGQLQLSWFDYPKAALTYQELANRAHARNDRPNETIYLTQLAYVYEQAKQPQPAIAAQQKLVALYEQLPDPKSIPPLKIKIGDNYQLLAQPEQAEQNYQSAYQLAQPTLQLAYASEALQKLGALYRANDRLDAALKVFDYLVSLEQQSYNLYGMMTAYDQIGQIQLDRKQNQQALAAFQKGLGLAKQLKYRQDYFTAQIQKIGK